MALVLNLATLKPHDAELELLKLTEQENTGRFGIAIDQPIPKALQDALDRLLMGDMIALIDVRLAMGNRVTRVWKITPKGTNRLNALKLRKQVTDGAKN